MQKMFIGSRATRIDVSSFNTENVTNMSRMFFNTVLTKLDLKSFIRVTYKHARDVRYSRVYGLDVTSFDTSKVTDMSKMFR